MTMSLSAYRSMIQEVIASFVEEVLKAADRNSDKDESLNFRYGDNFPPGVSWFKGWEGYNLNKKLREEVKEFMKNRTPEEAGDIGWVVAMMLDQKRKKQ